MICNIKRRTAGGIRVGTLEVGEIVQIAVSGVMTNFIVANQGIPADTGTGYDGSYDASCDGTWMIAEALMDGPKVYGSQLWSDNLTSWFSAMIDEKVMNAIRQATYPQYGTSVTAKITRPSVRELNFRWTSGGGTYDGAPLEYFLTTARSCHGREAALKLIIGRDRDHQEILVPRRSMSAVQGWQVRARTAATRGQDRCLSLSRTHW